MSNYVYLLEKRMKANIKKLEKSQKHKACHKNSRIHTYIHTCTHTQMRVFNKQKLNVCIDVGRNRVNIVVVLTTIRADLFVGGLIFVGWRLGDGGIYIKKSKKLHAHPPVRSTTTHPF